MCAPSLVAVGEPHASRLDLCLSRDDHDSIASLLTKDQTHNLRSLEKIRKWMLYSLAHIADSRFRELRYARNWHFWDLRTIPLPPNRVEIRMIELRWIHDRGWSRRRYGDKLNGWIVFGRSVKNNRAFVCATPFLFHPSSPRGYTVGGACARSPPRRADARLLLGDVAARRLQRRTRERSRYFSPTSGFQNSRISLH